MGDALATKAKGMWKRFGLLTQSQGTDDMLSTDMPFSEDDLQIVVEAFKFPVETVVVSSRERSEPKLPRAARGAALSLLL